MATAPFRATTLMQPGWAPGPPDLAPEMSDAAPGRSLLRLRRRMGFSTREVAEQSRTIAQQSGNPEFALSHARLVQIENEESSPGIHKLFSLSVIYGVSMKEILGAYLDLESAERMRQSLGLRPVQAPEPEFEDWLPVHHIHSSNRRYALIGLDDRTMEPLIRPGAMVEIDESQNRPEEAEWRNEFERPIYFLETRGGYLCSWCEMGPGQITAVPHPLSPCRTRVFAYPREAEVVGRITAIAGKI